MEEAKGVVKHVLLAKFKEGVTESEIEQLIRGFANLVNLIDPMESFHWGKNVSIENLHQGFTHIFESSFKSTEAVAEYLAHPAHVDFANLFLCLITNPLQFVSESEEQRVPFILLLRALYVIELVFCEHLHLSVFDKL